MKAICGLICGLFILGTSVVNSQELYRGPESVVFDEINNRYFVSNYYNGTIVQIDQNGDHSYFNTSWAHCLGAQIAGNTLYVSVEDWFGNDYLVGLDLTSGAIVMNLAVNTAICLDGITWDGEEFLYVVDVNGRILKVDIAAQTYSTLVGLASLPQDIVYDGANNRLLVARWTTLNSLLAINLSDLSLSSAMADAPGKLDGICMRDDGMVFLSSHEGSGKIYMWNGQYDGGAQLLSWPHSIPAGCCYNSQDDVLAVACQGDNTVVFIPLGDPDGDEILSLWDNCPDDYNPDQSDLDQDGRGNVCDICPGFDDSMDQDDDGVPDGCDNCVDVYNPNQEDSNDNDIGDACDYVCGDANGDRNPDIGDAVFIINHVFKGGPAPDPVVAGDANCDGNTDVGDAVYIINHVFKGGPAPCAGCE
ncbi:MAG: dockerin type I domain-containing protein [candidate division Zixibacteria bacterium]